MQVPPIEAIFFRDWKQSHIPEILDEIWIKEIYKPFLMGRKDQIIVDVGANIGLFSYYAKDFGKVYAIEPTLAHLECLRKMIEFNNLNITVCPYALSNKIGREKLYHLPNTSANSLGLFNDPKNFEEVETVSFDEFMIRNKLDYIDLLKLDPEGEEGKIITSEGFKKYSDKIKVIVGEWHDWCNMEKNQFANTLIDFGYEFKWIQGLKASVFIATR